MKKRKIIKQDFSNKEIKNFINFLWETRILKYMSRGGLHYLKGPAGESAAEHSFYTAIIGWILAKLEKVDENKVIKMCLIHDLSDARGGERNLVNKFYSQPPNEPKIIQEINEQYGLKSFPLQELFKEFFEGKTLEAKIAKDADVLSEVLLEKECLDLGNKKASRWLLVSVKRLKTKKGQELGKKLIEVDADAWWLEIAKKYIFKTKFL